jgi:hypothetical protein
MKFKELIENNHVIDGQKLTYGQATETSDYDRALRAVEKAAKLMPDAHVELKEDRLEVIREKSLYSFYCKAEPYDPETNYPELSPFMRMKLPVLNPDDPREHTVMIEDGFVQRTNRHVVIAEQTDMGDMMWNPDGEARGFPGLATHLCEPDSVGTVDRAALRTALRAIEAEGQLRLAVSMSGLHIKAIETEKECQIDGDFDVAKSMLVDAQYLKSVVIKIGGETLGINFMTALAFVDGVSGRTVEGVLVIENGKRIAVIGGMLP